LKNKQLPFWLILFSIISILLLATLLKDGMFLDGLVNGSIAKNMAFGDGSFWALQYTKTFPHPFYDQLPLAIGIQSVFFKIFGDHLFVERIYCILAAFITGIFIVKIWKHIFRDNSELAALSWLPVLFWIITPLVFWSYTNNMLENTMSIFDIAAVYLIIKALSTNKKIFFNLIISGLLILAAFFSKGPVGLFPLATVFIYWLCFNKISFSKTVIYSSIVLFSVILLLSLLFLLQPNSLYVVSKYLSQQVVDSVVGKRELAPSRYYIIGRLPLELIPIILLLLILTAVYRIKQLKLVANPDNRKMMFLFLLIAISGSLPIIVSLKQSGYYLVTSFPFYAVAAGIFAAPMLNTFLQKIKTQSRSFKIITIITMILFCGTFIHSFMQTGKVDRNKDFISDIYNLGKVAPKDSIISICPNMVYDWDLHAYMMRYFNISLDGQNKHKYYIINKNKKCELDKDYNKVEIKTNIYEIYKRK